MNYRIAIEGSAAADDMRLVEDGLEEFNLAHAPAVAKEPLVLLLHAEDGSVVGGLLGTTFWGWLRVDTLWLAAEARGQGLGTRILKQAEEEAIRRGCHHAFLDTLSFQALPFYVKQGYETYGELDDFPTGHKHHFLQKPLVKAPSASRDPNDART